MENVAKITIHTGRTKKGRVLIWDVKVVRHSAKNRKLKSRYVENTFARKRNENNN